MTEITKAIHDWEEMLSHTDEVLKHRISVYEHSEAILSAAQEEFRFGSSLLNKKDMSFLVFACILHGMAKYWIRKMRMMNDKGIKSIIVHEKRSSAILYHSMLSYLILYINFLIGND